MNRMEPKRTVEMYQQVDPEFKHRLKEIFHGETFKFCYQCGTCTAVCPVACLLGVYRPNKIIHLAKLGIRNVAHSNAIWLCASCNLCTKNCPQGVKVKDVMHALKDLAIEDGYAPEFSKEFITKKGMFSRFEEILSVLREEIPTPITYSWLCLRPSKDEEKSERSEYNKLVVNILNRSLSAYKDVAPLPRTRKEKIAVIGSGPAGLTAAWELARRGFPVTIFESLPKPGGMLRVGIPEFRLPKEVVDTEIGRIEDLGVEIRTDTPIDKELFNGLLRGGEYKAIFIGTGANKSGRLRIEGENLEGVIDALAFLRQANLKERVIIGKKVVVVGGGNVAMDAARTALRLGAEEIQMASLESREEMPAHEWEIREAIDERIVINPSWGPKKILGDGKRVTRVEFKKCTSVFDEKGRFSPSFDETLTKTFEADTVILAIGQSPDLSFLGGEVELRGRVIAVDPMTMETSVPGLFAGGDAVLGVASVIEAMVAGKLAAASIDRYLGT